MPPIIPAPYAASKPGGGEAMDRSDRSDQTDQTDRISRIRRIGLITSSLLSRYTTKLLFPSPEVTFL